MAHPVYEFPLKEKVRSYLRLEQLFKQLHHSKQANHNDQRLFFFEALFTLLDLLERLDIRNDILKDIDAHEKNLVHWSQHPNIDNDALQAALQKILQLREQLKQSKRIGVQLKEDRFLSSIRQRFAIPGGTCSFDLPNLHYWLHQEQSVVSNNMRDWLQELHLVEDAINITLSFLRERGRFAEVNANKGFYQGVVEDNIELIRILSPKDSGYYPTLSGNKYRYAIRFMWFAPPVDASASVEQDFSFKLASC